MERLAIIREFCKHLVETCGYTQYTSRCYATDLVDLVRFLTNDTKKKSEAQTEDQCVLSTALCEVNTKNIQDFIGHLTQRDYASPTIARKIASLRTFYGWALDNKKCKLNPMEKIPPYRVVRDLPPTLTQEEVERLLATPDNTSTSGLRDQALLFCLYYAAMTVDELITLQVKDIQFDDTSATITTNKLGQNGLSRRRVVKLDNEPAQVLKRFVDNVQNSKHATAWAENNTARPFFFNKFLGKMSPRCVRRTVEKYAIKAKLARPVAPKTIRTSRAVHLMQCHNYGSQEIMDFLGQRSTSSFTTYKHILLDSKVGSRAPSTPTLQLQ